MGSHRRPDDDGLPDRAPQASGTHAEHGDGGRQEPPDPRRAGDAADVVDHDGHDDEVGDHEDHFGLFDRDTDLEEPGPATGEVDLTDLRAALAGRPRPAATPRDSPGRRRGARAKRRRHPVRSTIIALLVLALIAGGVTVGVLWWQQRTAAPEDWTGTGSRTLVVRVQSGDGLYDVGQTLVSKGVVASVKTFVTVASDDGSLSGLQPGYYRVHEHSSAQSAVTDLANPDNRLGRLRIIPGDTLADVTKVSPTGQKGAKEGILSKIVDACVPTDGAPRCFTVDELWKVAETASLSDLGVVGWATAKVQAAPDPKRRLEGVILAGDYDVAPGSTAFEALRDVVSASAAQWNTTGIVAAAKKQGHTPYQLATIASLVQAEGGGGDMRKVARVIDNRLKADRPLQFDSTVNYGLDRASISTTESERLDESNPYSTYAHEGLTPTPIGAPGPDALDAADDPAVGDWMYFVAIDRDGNTCFSVTDEEHQQCVEKARANGVFG